MHKVCIVNLFCCILDLILFDLSAPSTAPVRFVSGLVHINHFQRVSNLAAGIPAIQAAPLSPLSIL